MKTSFPFLTALVLPLAGALGAHAAVNPAIVSADARWLVYADLNSLRQTTLGKELINSGRRIPFVIGAADVGVNWQKLLETIGSATAYGTTISPDLNEIDGTLIIEGKPELRTIAESLLLLANLINPKDVIELTDLPFPAYAIKEQKRPQPKKAEAKDGAEPKDNKPVPPKVVRAVEPKEIVIAFPSESIVIISKARPQILKARDVFKGTMPSLAKSPSPPVAKFIKNSEGAYFFTASSVSAEKLFKKTATQSRILQLTEAGAMALGERGENIFIHGDLVAGSAQMGEKLMKILQGVTAMLSLAETNDKALTDFLSSASVNRNGDTVSLDLTYSSARLATMVQRLQQKSGPVERAGAR